MNARRVIEKPWRWVAAHHPLVVFVWWALVAACMLASCEPVLAATAAHVGPTGVGGREGPTGGGDARGVTAANVGQGAGSAAEPVPAPATGSFTP
ncbi:MAG: hypothetical protein IT435_09555 [Phycisphaerales bacterium]|nr:hypothetical protein [Phycisphaerales bacterium]